MQRNEDNIDGILLFASDEVRIVKHESGILVAETYGQWSGETAKEFIAFFDDYDTKNAPPRLLIDVRRMEGSTLDVRFKIADFVKKRRLIGYHVVSLLEKATHLFIYRSMARITGSPHKPFKDRDNAIERLRTFGIEGE